MTTLTRRTRRTITTIAALLVMLGWIQAPANAGNKSTCPSGYFCVWEATNFDGDMHKYGSVDNYNAISVDPIHSAYNNRSKRTYLNEGSGSSSNYSCFGAGDSDAALSTWQLHANSAFLSTYTNCP